jgi:hypothetical protein
MDWRLVPTGSGVDEHIGESKTPLQDLKEGELLLREI